MECELCGDETEFSSDGVPVCPSCVSGFQRGRWGSELKAVLVAHRLAEVLLSKASADTGRGAGDDTKRPAA